MTRRHWAALAGVAALTGCDGSEDSNYKWFEVRYPGALFRIYYLKDGTGTTVSTYRYDLNKADGRGPWRYVDQKNVPLDLAARGVQVDSGTSSSTPGVRASGLVGAAGLLGAGGPLDAQVTLRPRIYILDVAGTDRVVALDGETFANLGIVPLGQTGPVGMVLSPDRTELYVAILAQTAIGTIPARPAAIQVLRANPLGLTRRFDLPASIIPRLVERPLVLSADGRTLYFINAGPFTPPVGYTASTLVRMDTASGAITGELGGLTPGQAFGPLALSADGKMLYSLSGNGVLFIDVQSFSLMTRVPLVLGVDMQLHPNGTRIYVSSSQPPRIQVVDTIAARTLPSITLAESGRLSEILLTGDGRFLFAHDAGTGALHIVDLEGGTKVGEFPLPGAIGKIGMGA